MIMLTKNELYLRYQPILSKIGIISRAIYLLTFTYIAALWISLTSKFIAIKRKNMKKNLVNLTFFNRFIITSVLTLTALAVTHTLWMGVSGIYELIVRE